MEYWDGDFAGCSNRECAVTIQVPRFKAVQQVPQELREKITQLLKGHGIEATFAEGSISARFAQLAEKVRRDALEDAALCAHWKRRAIEAIEHVPNDKLALAAKTVCSEVETSIRALLGERK